MLFYASFLRIDGQTTFGTGRVSRMIWPLIGYQSAEHYVRRTSSMFPAYWQRAGAITAVTETKVKLMVRVMLSFHQATPAKPKKRTSLAIHQSRSGAGLATKSTGSSDGIFPPPELEDGLQYDDYAGCRCVSSRSRLQLQKAQDSSNDHSSG